MSKLDQLKALGEAKRRASNVAKVGDGVALTSIPHPPGLIEKIAGAIRSGKLKVSPPNSKKGRPRIGEERTKPWIAAKMSKSTWYRRKRESAK